MLRARWAVGVAAHFPQHSLDVMADLAKVGAFPSYDFDFPLHPTMVPRFIPCLAALASALLVACHPYPENPQRRPGQISPPQPTPGSRTHLQAPQPAIATSGNLPRPPAADAAGSSPAQLQQPIPSATPKPPSTSKPPEPPKPDLPVASKAPGKEGYVLSPYNNKLILVRGIPSGTVVPDPGSPPSAKQYFRVP